jgi:hypothetical protein
MRPAPLVTPDGRYIVVDGRLWRRADPRLSDDEREALVRRLMHARRSVRAALSAHNPQAEMLARAQVHDAKRRLGERGPVWWHDGAPDLSRRLAATTDYRSWYKDAEKRRHAG